jgi:hypothetical protein
MNPASKWGFSDVSGSNTARIQGAEGYRMGGPGHGRYVAGSACQVAVRQPGKAGALDVFGRDPAAIRGFDRNAR